MTVSMSRLGRGLLAVAVSSLLATAVFAQHWSNHGPDPLEHVGDWPHGPCLATVAKGDLAVYAEGRTIVFQRLDGTEATDIATLVLDVPPKAMALGDGVLYAACHLVGPHRLLYAISILNPERPYVTHRIDGPGDANTLLVSGDLLLAVGQQFRVFDLADPRRPVELAMLSPYAHDVVRVGDYAYLTGTQGQVHVIDLHDPAAPVLLDSITIGQNLRDLELVGGHLAVLDRSLGLRILDLADPAAPALVATATGSGLNALAIDGDLAYAAADAGGIVCWDLADPRAPQPLGVTGTVGGADLALAGDVLLVAMAESGLQSLVVDHAGGLTHAWTREAYGEVRDVAVQGDYLYLACSWGGMVVLDASQPHAPVTVGRVDLPGSFLESIAVDGDLVCCLSNYYYDRSLRVIDVSDPADPVYRGSPGTYWASIYGLDMADGHAYVADMDYGVRVFDLADPDQPTEVSRILVGGPMDVAVRGDRAYVVDSYDRFSVADITDPTEPEVLAQVDLPHYAQRLALDGDFAYLGMPFEGLMVMDIAATEPEPRGFVDVPYPDNCWGVAGSGGMVFLSGNSDPMAYVIDAGDPDAPALVQETDAVGLSQGCAADDDHCYVACRGYGVHVYARHDPLAREAVAAAATDAVPHRCYPNPCNPRTEIAFELARAGRVSVTIHDLAGRRVARPWQGELAAGAQRVAWHGTTDGGRAAPSGLYVYRIVTPQGMACGKVQLVR